MDDTAVRSGHADRHACSATTFAELTDLDVEQSLVSRFAQQVAVHQHCLAVRDPELSLTYGELDSWANAIAATILDRDGGGSPVAILLPQGVRSIAAILGALKAGSPYVSLDLHDPRSRDLVERVGARVVVVGSDLLHPGRPTVVVTEPREGPDPGITGAPDDIAYVFFTSGSTGRPKGVFDSHRNVLHNVLRYTNTLRISPSDRLSLLQSPAFSGTASTLFSALLNGACLLPFSVEEHGVAGLARWLLDRRATVYHSVPAIFRSLVEVEPGPYSDVRLVRLEGDRATSFDVELHRRHFPTDSVLVNGLGLTETGLVRQLFVDRTSIVTRGALPVGFPVPGMEVTILDDAGAEVVPGTTGEIAVRSDYLAVGYWSEPDLTGAAFPCSESGRAYVTGDLGRLGEDGCLEYLGRRDGALKILGNRVEPAEVEAELLRLTGVANAAVTTREGRRGEGVLIAHVVLQAPGALAAGDIRTGLRERLPSHLVPTRIEFHQELPVGSSGKLDRRALSAGKPLLAAARPVTDLERLLAGIWERVLETSPIGLDDDFFAVGGDSLAVAEMVAQVEAETGRMVPPAVLAGSPTVRALAVGLHLPPAGCSSVVALRDDGLGAPLVLVHGNTGDVLHYSALVRAAGRDRPIWALEHPVPDGAGIAELAARHAAVLLHANPSGPHLLAGFCFGAVVAHETANTLVAQGAEVRLLALLGITPLEFPTVVSPAAREAWRRSHPPASSLARRLRRHAEDTWQRPLHERAGHVGRGVARVARRATQTRTRRRDRATLAAAAFQRTIDTHAPHRFPGQALVVLHEGDIPSYTHDPDGEWGPLAQEVEVVLLPGCDHDMLSDRGALRLARLLEDHARAARGRPSPDTADSLLS